MRAYAGTFEKAPDRHDSLLVTNMFSVRATERALVPVEPYSRSPSVIVDLGAQGFKKMNDTPPINVDVYRVLE